MFRIFSMSWCEDPYLHSRIVGFFNQVQLGLIWGGDSWSHHDGNLLDFEMLEVRIDGKPRTKHWKIIKNHFRKSIKKSYCLFFEAWCLLKTLVFQLSPQPLQSEVLMIFWAESPLTDHLDMCLLDSSCGFQKHLPSTWTWISHTVFCSCTHTIVIW